MKIEKVARV